VAGFRSPGECIRGPCTGSRTGKALCPAAVCRGGRRPLTTRSSQALIVEGGYFFDATPITQGELADTMGLSDVHMNRVIQRLRKQKLITLKGKNLVILDYARLAEVSGFNPNYLHLRQRIDAGNGNGNGYGASSAEK